MTTKVVKSTTFNFLSYTNVLRYFAKLSSGYIYIYVYGTLWNESELHFQSWVPLIR